MSRPFSFRNPTTREARLRQCGRCALCGDSLDDLEEHAHHVVPNQSGDPQNATHGWILTTVNCVVLCHVCHEAVHAGGRYVKGALAPPDYFMYSHGTDRAAHTRWAAEILGLASTVWPRSGSSA
jgi:hypothetical protein